MKFCKDFCGTVQAGVVIVCMQDDYDVFYCGSANQLLKIDDFLYRHFKRKGHTLTNILVQPVEKITYGSNSTSRFKIIKRHETELKWI